MYSLLQFLSFLKVKHSKAIVHAESSIFLCLEHWKNSFIKKEGYFAFIQFFLAFSSNSQYLPVCLEHLTCTVFRWLFHKYTDIVAWWHKWYKWPIPLSVVSQLFFLFCDKMYKGQTNFCHFYMLDLCTIVNSLFLKYCSNKKDKIVLCLIQYILWYDTNFMAGTEILLRLDIF